MKRKVIKLGPATLVVSLPSKWTKLQKVEAGEDIDILEQGNNLVLSSKQTLKKSETKLNMTNQTESAIRTMITNAYRLGFDRVIVTFKTEDQFKALNSVVKTRLIGFDVIKKEKDSCVIENITEPSSEQFDTLLQKMLYNISELINITGQRLKGEEVFASYEDIEEKIQQYDNFCKRVISKRSASVVRGELFWLFTTSLVHAQREVYILNRMMDKEKIKTSKDLADLFNGLSLMFDELKKAYLKNDVSLLEQVHEQEKQLVYVKAYKILRKSGDENIAAYHLASGIRNFYLAASPLMGLLTQTS